MLVRSIPYGESDLVATFFTKESGNVTTMVRGARRSQKRFGGALEPIHTLRIGFEDRGKELCTLKEARILRPRAGITGRLEAMEAAGRALRWLRHLCPARTPEPAAWASVEVLFDALDAGAEPAEPLASFGLRLLDDMGYGLELDRCTRCGRECPAGRAAFVDAARGGIVCSRCGGARRQMSAELRTRALAARRGESVTFMNDDAAEIVGLVEEAMAAHAGFDPK